MSDDVKLAESRTPEAVLPVCDMTLFEAWYAMGRPGDPRSPRSDAASRVVLRAIEVCGRSEGLAEFGAEVFDAIYRGTRKLRRANDEGARAYIRRCLVNARNSHASRGKREGALPAMGAVARHESRTPEEDREAFAAVERHLVLPYGNTRRAGRGDAILKAYREMVALFEERLAMEEAVGCRVGHPEFKQRRDALYQRHSRARKELHTYLRARRRRGTVGDEDAEVYEAALDKLRRRNMEPVGKRTQKEAKTMTGVKLSKETLEGLGLDEAALGPEVRLPAAPAGRIARGFVRAEAGADPASWEALTMNLPEVAHVGLELARAAHDPAWLLVRPRREGQSVRTLGATDGVTTQGDEVWVDTGRIADPLRVLLEDGAGLVLEPTSAPGVRAWVVSSGSADGMRLGAVAPPVLSWLASVDDVWLEGLVREALEGEDGWCRLVAAGRFMRLREPGHGDLAAARAGEASALTVREHAWARNLGAAWVEEALCRLETAARELGESLEAVAGGAAPDRVAWRDELLAVLHARDDLEGVALVLESAGAGDRVTAALEVLDEAGEDWIRSLPVMPELGGDERLLRASVMSPMGWWTEVVTWR